MGGVDERARRLTNFNMYKSKIKPVLFLIYFDDLHDIIIYGLLHYGHLKNINVYVTLYRMNLYCVTIIGSRSKARSDKSPWSKALWSKARLVKSPMVKCPVGQKPQQTNI